MIDECDRLFDMGFCRRPALDPPPLPATADAPVDDVHPRPSRGASMELGLGAHERRRARSRSHPEQADADPSSRRSTTSASREKISLLLGLLEREGARPGRCSSSTPASARAPGRRPRPPRVRRPRRSPATSCRPSDCKSSTTSGTGTLPILVATDVASAGASTSRASATSSTTTCRRTPEDYVHRIGRTARVGAKGTAITLACEDYVYSLDAIHKYIGYQIPVAFADDSLYRDTTVTGPRHPARPRGAQRAGKPPGGDDATPPVPKTPPRPARNATAPESTSPERPARRRRRRSKRGGGGPDSPGGGAPGTP